MRLIDADKTIKELNDKIARLDAKQQIYMENGLTSMADNLARKIELCIECRELIEHQPTAYDVDEVVEELDTYITKLVGRNSALYQSVIGIVKAGGINNNVSKKM